MDKQHYMISDAAALLQVEPHVLRYWEEELGLKVSRNELGHRYYTKENIEQCMKIKEWKEQNYSLKEIRKKLQHMDSQEVVPVNLADNTRRLEQFKSMMNEIVKGAIEENNLALSREVSQQVRDYVLKEMNYLMREQDEAEEERYKKLDELIRQNLKVHMKKEKKVFGKKLSLKPNRV